jgi:CheY-like chemotaxis protein
MSMRMTTDRQEVLETPPEEFARSVKGALESLYDLPALQRHPLTQGSAEAARPGESAGQRLRSEMMSAIEALNPGPATPFRSPHARTFNLLHLHYVEGMTVQETARELGLSERQAYRDLRQADAAIAALLWAKRSVRPSTPAASEPGANTLSSVEAEMDRLPSSAQSLELRALLTRVLRAVERLAAQRGVTLLSTIPADPVAVSADPVLAQQIFTHLLSQAIQQARPGELHVQVMVQAEGATATLRYRPEAGQSKVGIHAPIVVQLTERLGWQMEQSEDVAGRCVVTVKTKPYGPSVLVIDDNQGLTELLRRYLTGLMCRVWTATNGSTGLELAAQFSPDAIILDVMMPEMDGWELLQRLRSHPSTAAIPVIICSVFNDPELAYSLGASTILTKPVKQIDLVDALRQLRVL